MKTTSLRLAALLALGTFGAAVASLSSPVDAAGFSFIGGNLSLAQRDFRVFNNFTDASANNNVTPHANFPGQTGAVMAIWKGHAEWGSEPRAGNGLGDGIASNPILGDGGANFDNTFQGTHTANGTINDNVHSEIAGSSGNTLAFTQTPISDGWRIRYYASWTWQDGPASVTGGQDLQGVACHEIGHSLGLGHSTASGGPTMSSFISGTGVAQRSIAADDISGIKAIYGAKSASKPHIGSLAGSTTPGGTLTINGTGFSAANNEVWFTRQGNLGNPQKVLGLASSGGGTVINVVIPGTATDGEVLVKNSAGNSHANLSNAWPIDIGGAATYAYGFTELQPGLGTATGAMPFLTGGGDLSPGAGFWIEVDSLQSDAPGLLLASFGVGAQPFKGGTLYAWPIAGQLALATGATGQLILESTMPDGLSGLTLVLQAWFADPDGPQGAVASNGLQLDLP